MQDFIDIVKTHVLSDVEVSSVIKNRFYYGQLATIKDAIFPCANFDVTNGSLIEKIAEAQTLPFNLWVWSGKSQEQCFDVYNKIFNVIHNTCKMNNIETISVVLRETARPLFRWDATEELYYLMGRWSAYLLKYS